MTRQETLDAIRQKPEATVLIIGAGINGIGVFRDLALQGVDVLLVDRGDFCAGTSAASSHMVHGGVRYLENGEFRLVREAVHERNRLLQNAPHYVRPLPTTIPIFKWFSGLFNAPLKFLGWLDKPSERGAVVIKTGLMLYDAYTRAQATVPKHRFAWRQASLQQYPRLNPDILCTATYYDGAMRTPERIALELILDGEADFPAASAVNYLSVTGATGPTVTLRDEVSGQTFDVSPKIVINAAGPWIDLTNRAMRRETRFIGGTKGSHLVLNHPELRQAIGEHEFFFENKDGRIVLIYPLLDKVLIGASDLPVDDPDQARCAEEEVDYFLSMARHVFPAIHLERSHIVFRFSGVRPLPTSEAATAGQISRDHSVRVIEPDQEIGFPIYSLIGGKWTTFRAFAGQTTDLVLARLGLTRRRSTADLPIGGGRDYPRTAAAQQEWLAGVQARSPLPFERLKTLFERYGTRAEEIATFIAAETDHPLTHKPDYSQREVIFLALREKVVHLDDLVLRRSLLAMLGELTAPLVRELAQVAGQALGWPAAGQEAEIARTCQLMAEHHGVRLAEKS